MRPRVDITSLLRRTVGRISARIEGVAIDSIGGVPSDPEKIVTEKHLKLINEIPSEFTGRVANLLRSMNPDDALPFLLVLAAKQPARFALLVQNDVIASRMQHTKKIAELCAVFDFKRISRIHGSINQIKQQVFEISSEYDRLDIHARMVNDLPEEGDEEEHE